MATGIATLVCYAGVFNDVIGIEEIATRLGLPRDSKFDAALADLNRQGRVILRDGFASLPNLGDRIALKAAKAKTAQQLIASGMKNLRRLGENPFVKFVGISGSLAAANPTKDKDGLVDIDVFLITRNQCLWLYEIPRRLQANFSPKTVCESTLCINYVMDGTNLLVENRNFYTATEIRNLIPVSGLIAFREFLQANSWVDYYYPGFSGRQDTQAPPQSWNLINRGLYVLVVLLYCIKYGDLSHLKKLLPAEGNPSGSKFNRVSSRCGGYQVAIHQKFTRLAATCFADLIDRNLIAKLFPDELSRNIQRGISASMKSDCDFSKYGSPQILSKSG